MKVLVVNAGSSSLKSQLVETDGKRCLMKALGERLGTDAARLKVTFGEAKRELDVAGKGVDEVLGCVLDALASDPASPLAGLSEIEAVGNRIVSGGEYFSKTVLVDDDVLAKID